MDCLSYLCFLLFQSLLFWPVLMSPRKGSTRGLAFVLSATYSLIVFIALLSINPDCHSLLILNTSLASSLYPALSISSLPDSKRPASLNVARSPQPVKGSVIPLHVIITQLAPPDSRFQTPDLQRLYLYNLQRLQPEISGSSTPTGRSRITASPHQPHDVALVTPATTVHSAPTAACAVQAFCKPSSHGARGTGHGAAACDISIPLVVRVSEFHGVLGHCRGLVVFGGLVLWTSWMYLGS
ncbi:hypothetical protein BJX76DRAFT_30063 [Aspergillus varians]